MKTKTTGEDLITKDQLNRYNKLIYSELEERGADPDLLAIVGSIGDTLDTEEALDLLVDYKTIGKALRELN